jgi:catalase
VPHEALATLTEKYHLEGDVVRRKISLTNDFEQAAERYRSLGKVDQDHLVDNIVDSLGKADKPIQLRMVEIFPRPTKSLAGVWRKGLELN